MISNAAQTVGIASLAIACLFPISIAQGQIVPDATLPINSQVSSGSCPACIVITGGTERGVNLYHSFREFSILTGGEAYFNNAIQIQNILTRVTGSSISNIDGLIRANGLANVYLLNPNGIVFGPNARLNIGGSFVATTATSFQFPGGSTYSAIAPQEPPVLTVNVIPGVQYGARPAGSTISNAGNLTVSAGQSITLLGGITTSTGTLSAPQGTVQMLGDRVALQANARVNVSSPTLGGTVLIGGDYKGQGTVPNATQTYVGPNATINANASLQGNGGRVIVWSDGTTTFYGSVNARGGSVSGTGGFVEVSGKQNLVFQGLVNAGATNGRPGTLLVDPTNIEVVTDPGNGVLMDVSDPRLPDRSVGGTRISAGLFTNPDNDIILAATNNITFSAPITITGTGVELNATAGNSIFVNSDIRTNGGTITLNAQTGDLVVNNGVTIDTTDTATPGEEIGDITLLSESGNVYLNSSILRSNNQNNLSGTNSSGNITVLAQTGSVFINQSQINTSNSETGLAGSILITARDRVLLQNGSTVSSTGNNGEIFIGSNFNSDPANHSITPVAGALASSFTIDTTQIITDSGDVGNAGNISIYARDQGLILRSNVSSADSNEGNAGAISISTRNQLLIQNSIVSSVGNNGQISIGSELNPDKSIISGSLAVFTLDNSQITTNSVIGNAGDVLINARDRVLLQNSRVSSQGNNGRIFIGTDLIRDQPNETITTSGPLRSVILDHSQVTTNDSPAATMLNMDRGIKAGDISINARDQISIQNGSTVSSQGNNGQIFVGTEFSFNSGIVSTSPGPLRSLTVLNNSAITTNDVLNLTSPHPNSEIFAGRIFINARDHVLIQNGSAVSSQGNQGTIAIGIRDGTLTLDRSQVSVNQSNESIDSGIFAGDITIMVPSGKITLDRSAVTATSKNGHGGNIIIDPDILLLRHGSRISTSAGNDNTPGDGGNITITAKFLLAVLSENSDITANAYSGSGGNITINASGIFGFFTPLPGILDTAFSDIAASSQLGINGTVILNVLNIDPSQGLGELNLVPIDGSQLIAQSCITGKREALNANRFVIMGRSGIPANPEEVFRSASILTDLGMSSSLEHAARHPSVSVVSAPELSPNIPPNPIVEAQGWIVAPNGKIRLVAEFSTPTPSQLQPLSNCPPAENP